MCHKNKTMKYFLGLAGLIILFTSCKEDTKYSYSIAISNLTNKQLQIKVFPKPQYIKRQMYQVSSYGDFSDMEFTLQANASKTLFQSTNLDYVPQQLLAEIFDSLSISIDSGLIIKFKPDSVENYKINMFSGNSLWTYKKLEGGNPTSFRRNPTVTYFYEFEIKQENIGN
jgi:hypothetical protein